MLESDKGADLGKVQLNLDKNGEDIYNRRALETIMEERLGNC
jgi:hypothetical protein